MIHNWPIENSLDDKTGGKHMTIQINGELATDRFGNENSSLFLNDGYATVPSGVYFNPDTNGFTVMAWMKFKEFGSYARLIDFGLGQSNNNILVSLYSNELLMILEVFPSGLVKSTKTLIKNQWYHVAATVNGQEMKMYIDGVLTGSISGIYLKIFDSLDHNKSFCRFYKLVIYERTIIPTFIINTFTERTRFPLLNKYILFKKAHFLLADIHLKNN